MQWMEICTVVLCCVYLSFRTSQEGYRTCHSLSTFKPTTKLYIWSNTEISNREIKLLDDTIFKSGLNDPIMRYIN
jgi:hypothetical protein